MLINGIELLSVREMAERLQIQPSAVKVRLHVAGETPVSKDALYSLKSFEAIKDSKGKGRPKKPTSSEAPEKPRKPSIRKSGQ
jgi:DNA-binding transcriptional regulator YhcF (GntR family)